MKQIVIPGTTTNLKADDHPAISAFGHEVTGKTRFALTMPAPIGYIAIDRKAKRTMELLAEELGLTGRVHVNDNPFITNKQMRDLATVSDLEAEAKSKAIYTEVTNGVWDLAFRFVESPDIQSIVVDRNSQLFDWVLFAHHGRKTKIDPKTGRGAPNQWMIDFISMCRSKNLLLIHGVSEIWKDTGKTNSQGDKIQEPSGKFKQDGFKNIGSFVLANLEMLSHPLTAMDQSEMKHDEEAKLAKKFRMKVHTCQTNSLIEGTDLDGLGVSGKEITWNNVMTALGVE